MYRIVKNYGALCEWLRFVRQLKNSENQYAEVQELYYSSKFFFIENGFGVLKS